MIGQTIPRTRRVSEDDKILTEYEKYWQGVLQKETCGHLYVERYPTGYSGMFQPQKTWRCDITKRDCVANKNGFFQTIRLTIKGNTAASREGIDEEIVARCPARGK